MGNDLIKRRDTIENMWSLFNNTYNDAFRFDEEETELARKVLVDAQRMIESQPTAYDVDKVVEQINNLDIKAIPRYKGGAFGDYEGMDYYIKKSDVLETLKTGLMQ